MARKTLVALLGAALAGASLAAVPLSPATAAADTTAPQVEITSPVADTSTPVYAGDALQALFTCTDPTVVNEDTSGVASCEGALQLVPDPQDPTAPSVDPVVVHAGDPIDTSSPGSYRFTVTGADVAGNVASSVVEFTISGRPPADSTGPVVTVASPVDGALVKVGGVLNADYSCQDFESGLVDCHGDVASGAPVNTSTSGDHTFTVTGTDAAGNVTTKVVHYTVVVSESVILRGRIQGPDGTGLSGAVAQASLAGSTDIVARTTAGTDGRYSLALAAGTYDLRFRGPAGSGLGADIAGRTLTSDTSLDVTVVQFVTHVSVQVDDGMGGHLESGNVTAYSSTGQSAGEWSFGTTGQVELTLNAGDYYLSYNGVSDGGAASFYGETDVLSLDHDQSVTLHPATRSTALTVHDADGALVDAHGSLSCQAHRDLGQRRVLESVSRQVTVDGSGSVPLLTAGETDGCRLQLATVDGLTFARVFDSGVGSYDVTLARPVQVTGQVIDGLGGTVQNGYATLSGGRTGQLTTTTPLDAAGGYSFRVEPDTYDLSGGASSGNLDSFSTHRSVAASQDMVADLALQPRPVHLVLQRTNGTPVNASVDVSCSSAAGAGADTLRLSRTVTGDATVYGLTRPDQPACQLAVRPVGEAQVHQDFDATSPTANSLTVVIPDSVHLTGTVSDGAAGVLRREATVEAVKADGSTGGSVSSDLDGQYALPIAAGRYQLSAYGSTTKANSFSVTTAPADFPADTRVDLAPKLYKLTVHLRGPDGSSVHGVASMSCATTDQNGLAYQSVTSSADFTGSGELWGMNGTGYDGGPACWFDLHPDSGAPVSQRLTLDPSGPNDLVVYTAGGVLVGDGTDVGQDGDNVSDLVEALGPHNGDGNQDGVADYLQANVTSVPSSGGSGEYVTVAVPSGVALTNVSTLPLTDPSISSAPPAGVTLPSGLVQFRLDGVPLGSDQTVSLFPSSTAGVNGYAKYHDGQWLTLPADRVTVVGGQSGPARVDVRLTDGGVGDDDGKADGSILDPGGLAVLKRADTQAPVVTVSGVTQGARYVLGAAPQPSCSAADEAGGSGLAGTCSLVVTGGNANKVGDYTATATATDKAGNVGTTTVRYRVEYRFDGFDQPVNDPTTTPGTAMSVFQGGSTVPFRFRLKRADGSTVSPLTDPVWLAPEQGAATSAAINEGLVTTPGAPPGPGVGPVGGQYQYVWSTKKSATGYQYRIGVQLDDGTTHYVTVAVALR